MLNPRQQRVTELKEQGFTIRQIADEIGITYDQVRSTLQTMAKPKKPKSESMFTKRLRAVYKD